MENLYIIAGLGNPGREYDGTRHNIGFMLVDLLAEQWRAVWTLEKKFSARVAKVDRDGRKLILCQPQTFMNSSGEALRALVDFYQAPLPQVLVAVDDADLPLGHIRLRSEGSSGGHHGLESVEQQLATRNYPRLRLGIGRRESDGRQISNYVLGRFAGPEKEIVDEVLNRARQQVECWLAGGVLEAMNKFNGAAKVPAQKGKQ